MKHLNIKFLMMLICGTFVMNTALAATVNNKSSSFKVSSGTTTSTSSSDSAMAEKIRAQRAALDARDAQGIVATGLKAGATNNDCDGALRKCIEKKCGTNYSKCATDNETIFSDKLTACKKDAGCTAHEFTLFTNQIREDKKQEIALASYNNVIDCGTSYNNCIIDACGPKFAKCLSKSAGDKALNKCKQIAARCTEADSGMAGRMGNIFGIVRQNEEIQIAADEKKLYELRDRMESSCKSLGAMFDERSFDCVFTAYFFAGPEAEPKASKKLYAGSTFDCTPDWFGIDITTFKENAYRATRAQTAASSAMLGSGVGTAVGTITSGAMGRALDRQKAEKELKEACDESQGMIFDKKKGECRKMNDEEKKKAAEEAKKADDKKKQDEADAAKKTAKENCLKRNKDKKTYGDGKWVYDENNKIDPCSCEGNLESNKCIKFTSDEKKNQKLKEGCESGKHEGNWTPPVAPETIGTCDCNDDAGTSYYQSKGAPFHCIASAKQMGANIRTGINKAVCKTKEGFVKLANGTVEAFTGEPGEKALPDCTDDKIHEREQNRDATRQANKDKKANQKNEKEAKQNACNAISGTMKKDTCVKDGIVYDLKKSSNSDEYVTSINAAYKERAALMEWCKGQKGTTWTGTGCVWSAHDEFVEMVQEECKKHGGTPSGTTCAYGIGGSKGTTPKANGSTQGGTEIEMPEATDNSYSWSGSGSNDYAVAGSNADLVVMDQEQGTPVNTQVTITTPESPADADEPTNTAESTTSNTSNALTAEQKEAKKQCELDRYGKYSNGTCGCPGDVSMQFGDLTGWQVDNKGRCRPKEQRDCIKKKGKWSHTGVCI